MFSNSFDDVAYYSIYKSAVYENLFAGIVYGEQPSVGLDCSGFIGFLSHVTGTYTVLYVVSVHILL
jgi:hypothetical protein